MNECPDDGALALSVVRLLGIYAVAWTLYGVIGSQLGDVNNVIEVEGQATTVQAYISDTYGFRQDGLWYCVIILLGFSVAFWFVVAGESVLSLPSPLQ
jgi:hypothetical protein